ncbi:MAG TPA: HAMP domain-containing sensor histidine kinase [Candidatus Angelobacter sp.]|nr:HAMP domain-containing sensor histidine kinase [Candidatus Angelobacter sp.]
MNLSKPFAKPPSLPKGELVIDIGNEYRDRDIVIKLRIFSSESRLLKDCRSVLDEICPESYELADGHNASENWNDDIYIWDGSSDLPGPMAKPSPAAKLIVVSRNAIGALRHRLPHGDFVFLHSPVTPLALRVFLESAIARLSLNSHERAQRLQLDRDRILEKLLETNRRLQEYETDRTNFLMRAVHDLRVPLMALQGYSGLLLAAQLGSINSEQAAVLEKMQRSARRLGRLADAMLGLGMGANASVQLNLENASLEDCVHQAIHEIMPIAVQKKIHIDLQMDPPHGTLTFDAGQIEQVMVNLLDNGCKFTPKRGSIDIRGYSTHADELEGSSRTELPAGYRIDVSDSGSGIPAERLEDIFSEYTSYSGSADRSGAGLGLAICKIILNAHNGRIWASCAGRGASFSFVLPYVSTRRGVSPHAMKVAV